MSLSESPSKVVSPSGIQDDGQGNRYVGGTVREDGSVRKVYKVRSGYTPTEDVPKYVSIGRRRLQGTIPGETDVENEAPVRRFSPHLANINKILQGSDKEEPGRLRNKNTTRNDKPLLKTDSEFPSLGSKPNCNDLVESMGRLNITPVQKASRGSGDIKTTNKSDETKKSPTTERISKEATKTSPPKPEADAKTASEVPTASRGKYIPPWKRQ